MTRNNLNKIDIAYDLSKKKGFSVQYSKKLVDDLLNIIINSIKKNNFNLKNFGSFILINKKQRLGRNPRTKKISYISARKSISFSPSKKILEKINNWNE